MKYYSVDMKTKPDCAICLLKQYLNMNRMCGVSEEKINTDFYEMLKEFSDLISEMSPPEAAAYYSKVFAKKTGNKDPYYQIKRASNKAAMQYYKSLKERVLKAPNKFAEALSLAIAGNLIDFGAKADLNISDAIDEILNQPLLKKLENGEIVNTDLFMFNKFYKELKEAEDIIYLGDNAGEIVFDRIFIETILSEFPEKKISFVVRGAPALNDVLMEDAKETGLSDIIEVISSGSPTPGTVLKLCSKDFLKRFNSADMIISKGQGNFESLFDEEGIKQLWFLFRIKCFMVSDLAGGPEGTLVLKKL